MSRPWYFEVDKDSNKIYFLRDGAAPGDGKQFGAVKKVIYNKKRQLIVSFTMRVQFYIMVNFVTELYLRLSIFCLLLFCFLHADSP